MSFLKYKGENCILYFCGMNNSPASISDDESFDLKLKINVVKAEIEQVRIGLHEFEAILRNFVLDDMIEEQELAAKYRNFQKAKRAKRQAQKKKGKNYKEPIGIVAVKNKSNAEPEEVKLERKKIYREAMLLVHPDRTGGDEREKENATEITAKLVDIYNGGNLEELQIFCAHIQNQQRPDFNVKSDIMQIENASKTYYESELQKYESELAALKAKHTYKVLSTYARPIDFAQELKDYYKERIEKLKKRTRKVK